MTVFSSAQRNRGEGRGEPVRRIRRFFRRRCAKSSSGVLEDRLRHHAQRRLDHSVTQPVVCPSGPFSQLPVLRTWCAESRAAGYAPSAVLRSAVAGWRPDPSPTPAPKKLPAPRRSGLRLSTEGSPTGPAETGLLSLGRFLGSALLSPPRPPMTQLRSPSGQWAGLKQAATHAAHGCVARPAPPYGNGNTIPHPA